jgi:hypothetical protein
VIEVLETSKVSGVGFFTPAGRVFAGHFDRLKDDPEMAAELVRLAAQYDVIAGGCQVSRHEEGRAGGCFREFAFMSHPWLRVERDVAWSIYVV